MNSLRQALWSLTYLSYLIVPVYVSIVIYRNGVPPGISAAIAIGGVGVCMLFMQRVLAFRDDWRSWRKELAVDLLHYVFSTGTVSRLTELALLAVATGVAAALSGSHEVIFWPETHIALQLLLALLIADAGTWAVHRWMHHSAFLWRFHSLHHSSERMHILASGRSHPVNTALIYLAQTAPLIVLGAPAEVLVALAVFTASNGMLQHSNIRFRIGLLNLLLMGPELHRFHHSVDEAESAHNFGSNIALWDHLAGTWLLPTGEARMRDVGLPAWLTRVNFFDHLAAPFRRELPAPDDAGTAVTEG